MMNVHALMNALAAERPVFHTEADFQHALAWLLHKMYPQAIVRLEKPIASNGRRQYLDVWFQNEEGIAAIELKYLTRALACTIAGESFALQNQGAQDISRYDVVKDVVRVEHLMASSITGYAIALTNDSAYWTPPTRPTICDAFRLHEGRILTDTLHWGANAGAGTTRGRETPLTVVGTYPIRWRHYSTVAGCSYGEFRYMVVQAAQTR